MRITNILHPLVARLLGAPQRSVHLDAVACPPVRFPPALLAASLAMSSHVSEQASSASVIEFACRPINQSLLISLERPPAYSKECGGGECATSTDSLCPSLWHAHKIKYASAYEIISQFFMFGIPYSVLLIRLSSSLLYGPHLNLIMYDVY